MIKVIGMAGRSMMRHLMKLARKLRPYPAVFIIHTGDKKAIMEESKKSHKVDYGCESRCVEEFVKCIETENGASICKTRERNCFDECLL